MTVSFRSAFNYIKHFFFLAKIYMLKPPAHSVLASLFCNFLLCFTTFDDPFHALKDWMKFPLIVATLILLALIIY